MSQLPHYESYKDSGVQWLGEIPSHWAVKKLKFLTSYFKGFAFKSEDFSDIGIPLIKASNVKKFSIENVESHIAFEKVQDAFDRVKLQEGDLILSTVGSLPNVLNSAVGQIAYVSSDFAGSYLNQNNVCFRSNEKVIPIFLKYFVMSSFFRRNLDVKALWIANQAYLEVLDVQNISIIFPDLEEQKIIADFLDKRLAQVDALIAKQETLLEKLAEQRVALISHAVTKGLNPDVEIKESKISWVKDIPNHWNVVPVRYLFEFKNNQRIPVSAEDRGKMSEKIYPYYGASGIIDFVEDYIFDEDLLLVAEDGANLLSRSTPLAFKASGKYWVNNHAHIIKPLDNNLTYWEYVLALYDFTPLISGSAQPKLTKDNLASIKLPNPPDEEKRKICNFLNKPLENLKEQKLKIEKILETLKEYRSTLITQVVTGKIDVRNLKLN